MTGCLKNFLATVGCLTLLALAGGAGWVFRDQLGGLYRSVAHRADTRSAADAGVVGRPSPTALRDAQLKQTAIGRRGGPATVVLTADEVAALIEAGLDPATRQAIDSLRIGLGPDRLTLQGWLVTDVLGRTLLGPLAALLEGREPIALSGPVRLLRPGRLAWEPDSFMVRAFPFPGKAVPRLIDRLTGRSDGGVRIGVPEAVTDVRIRPDGMTFFPDPLMARRVLVVDDEKGVRDALRQLLEYEQIEVKTVSSGADALAAFQEFHPHLVLLDVKMAGMNGLETLTRLREVDPAVQVVMISGHGTIQTAVEATQMGAYDFLEKPLDTDRILLTLKNAFERVVLSSENERLRASLADEYDIVGASPAIREVLAVIAKVAPTGARVLIHGENGSGKELVARAIHRQSPRAHRPFVEVNCAAIPTELIESELFGHMKGSFTGAVAERPGKFELADEGTLFLDEVADMSLAAQAKVLRALQEGVVTRVGGSKPLKVDVRVIAATNKALETEIAAGRFREDLFYRLNVVPIEVPPLRSRREDIPKLVERFVAQLVRGPGLGRRRFAAPAVQAMAAREWPGNVRELRNAVERLLILSSGDVVTETDVARLGGAQVDAMAGALSQCETFEAFKQEAERAFLTAKLAENGWNVSETARKLAMPRSNLYKKIERYGLQRDV